VRYANAAVKDRATSTFCALIAKYLTIRR
jgi:hypothetical protein